MRISALKVPVSKYVYKIEPERGGTGIGMPKIRKYRNLSGKSVGLLMYKKGGGEEEEEDHRPEHE